MSENSTVNSVIYGSLSQAERIFILVLYTCIAIVSTILNGSIIYMTFKVKKFHGAYMYVRAAYCGLDIVFALFCFLHYCAHFFISNIPLFVTCLSGDFRIGIFLGAPLLTSVIALERYYYFCRPYQYERLFNLRTILLTFIIATVIGQLYAFGTEIAIGRQLKPLLGICLLEKQRLHGLIQFVAFYVPSIICTWVCVHRIVKLVRTLDTEPHCQASNSDSMQRSKIAKKSLK